MHDRQMAFMHECQVAIMRLLSIRSANKWIEQTLKQYQRLRKRSKIDLETLMKSTSHVCTALDI